METRLEAMEQQVFKCQGMVERGLNANDMMITEFTNNHKMDAIDIGKHLSSVYDKVDQLQGQIYDLHNQNCGFYRVFVFVFIGTILLQRSGRRKQTITASLGWRGSEEFSVRFRCQAATLNRSDLQQWYSSSKSNG
ncbi:40s ribosomal protein s5-1 [Hordeum vulgare]|nr:40s ribosomal protein s5-1 [Hordeum vulgare]